MKKAIPVQIIGTQRSGSNLLRLMLNQIEGVFAPHPPHILSVFYPLLPAYGNLEEDDNFRSLIDDVCRLVELNPVQWHRLVADRAQIFEMCQYRSLAEVFRNLYEINARSHKADYWICKSMQNVKYLNYFHEIGFRPKVIYLYRDGRDVALSFKKALVGPKHIYSIAKKWREEQELSLKCMEDKALDCLSLSYESLLRNPEKQLKQICTFLGLNYNQNALKYYTSRESIKTAEAGEMWQNLTYPIITKNINKYKKGLTEEEIHIFEVEAREVLVKLGYKLSTKSMPKYVSFSTMEIESFEKMNEQLMGLAKQRALRKDIEKRSFQSNFINELRVKYKIVAA